MELKIMDMSVIVSLAQVAQSAMQHDPFGWTVVYPTAMLTGMFMIWAAMQANPLTEPAR
jgi:hypothetical protein